MNQTTIYLKGNPGFMPAVITRLGRKWIDRARNIDEDVISISLPEKMSLDELKDSIGTNIITEHNVLFFDELPGSFPKEAPWKFVPGHTFRMSIWTDGNSKLTATKTGDYNEESKTAG